MSPIFIVVHEYETAQGDGDLKLIGAFSSEAKALAAIESLRQQPGFKAYPDGFVIEASELDTSQWSQGF